MERDILVEVNHPFIVKLHYGELQKNSFLQHSVFVNIAFNICSVVQKITEI